MKIRDAFDINPPQNTNKYKDFINYFDTASVVNGRVVDVNYLESDFPSRAQRLIKYDDILYSSVRPNLKHYYHYLDNYNHAVASTGFFILRNKNKDKVNSKFAYYYLASNSVVNYLHSVAEISQATFPACSNKDIGKIELPNFNINYQNKISEILYKYDELISNNIKQIKVLEEIAETLYKEWFVHFRFPDYKDVEFDSVKSKGWVLSTDETKIHKPRNWNLSEIGNIATFIRGKNITAAQMIDGDIPVISAGLEPSGYHNSANVKGESITISASGANAGYLSYHLSNIWAADCSYYNDKTNLWFVYNTLKFLQPFINNMQVGSAQPHVYAKNINKISVIIPEEKYILMYCEKVENIYQQIKILMDSNKNLIEQRDLLLPRLMSGKLEIN